MIEEEGDMFESYADAMAITTNGFLKKNNESVMGRGCARQLADLYPWMPRELGRAIGEHGNCVNPIGYHRGTKIYSFPVKPISVVFDGKNAVGHMARKFRKGETIPGWAAVAQLDLIELSARQLKQLADKENHERILIPRPGCGAGELKWEDVRPVLNDILDDRFISMHNE